MSSKSRENLRTCGENGSCLITRLINPLAAVVVCWKDIIVVFYYCCVQSLFCSAMVKLKWGD